eukprot:TRINITY_DN1191_c0_g1_i1.p1 TRINITY_DN1191_c0_g1~~TRINITY_DN1191_c0_g1_i1.p1  ORF type:complete len:141 (-),score=11.26 TRINITY_DN1191_c0_g1_i1:238-660(-)
MSIIFLLPFPFLCIGLCFCCCGYNQKLKFDNLQQEVSSEGHSGMFCVCCNQFDHHVSYSDITKLDCDLDMNSSINGEYCGKLICTKTDGSQVILLRGLQYHIVRAKCDDLADKVLKCNSNLKVDYAVQDRYAPAPISRRH